MSVIVAIISLVFGPICYWAFISNERRRRLYEDTPTSKTIAVFVGEVELKGDAVLSPPLKTKLTSQDAVWYSWSVEEEWRRTEMVPVTKTDANGKTHTEMEERVTSGWTTVDGSTLSKPFYLKDEAGVVRINPEMAKIEPKITFYETCTEYDPLYYKHGPREAVSDSTGNRRFSESAILVGQPIFVMGRARVRDDAVAAEVAWNKDYPEYLISVRTEEEVTAGVHSMSVTSWVVFVLISMLIFGVTFQNWVYSFWGIPVGLAALFPGWLWIVHQSMVRLKNRSKQARSNVDVELKRRYSLITPLIDAVKGIRDYEAETQEAIAALRSQLEVKTVSDANREGVLVPVADRMLAVIEKYPQLKSEPLFLNLQKNLVETEDRIALARQYYNDTVEYVNSRREAFPEGLVARLSGVERLDYFHAEEFERPPVQVEL
ncbi:MAG: LemA family protein [Thermoguttaceae bacterium]|nr:LemA family protein [Thermoguttaceae bacterium]